MAVELASYRKGLTLGLTLAEIFILLLFLLLLILLGYYTVAEKRNAELNADLTVAEKRNDELTAELIEMREVLVAEQRKVEQLRELPKEKQDLVRKVEELQETLQSENGISQNLLDEQKTLREQARALESKVKQLRELLYAQKGLDPPCWYKSPGKGATHKEQPHHLIDVAVHDEHLLIRLVEPPEEWAIKANGEKASTSYKQEYAELPLAPLHARSDPKEISTTEFLKLTKPIRIKGKSKQVRDYSCVFYARVWDKTSETAKERWKKTLLKIGERFYTTLVHNDPWVKK